MCERELTEEYKMEKIQVDYKRRLKKRLKEKNSEENIE